MKNMYLKQEIHVLREVFVALNTYFYVFFKQIWWLFILLHQDPLKPGFRYTITIWICLGRYIHNHKSLLWNRKCGHIKDIDFYLKLYKSFLIKLFGIFWLYIIVINHKLLPFNNILYLLIVNKLIRIGFLKKTLHHIYCIYIILYNIPFIKSPIAIYVI